MEKTVSDDVAAVLAEAECIHRGNLWNGGCYQTKEGTHPECALAALAAAGYAVVKVPEDIAAAPIISHGMKLVASIDGQGRVAYRLEDTP